MTESSRCAFVAIVGRPNVGKSTLLNRILGRKISITSRKAQTTRHQILGVKTVAAVQIVYVDTPGLHQHERCALNRYMNRTVVRAMRDVDIAVFVVEANKWTEEDDLVLEKLKKNRIPVILVINKVDTLTDKQQLLTTLEQFTAKHAFSTMIPLSAKTGKGVERLEQHLAELAPESVHFYPDDQITDRSDRFIAAEIVREKLTRLLGKELPYSITVEVENFEDKPELLTLHILILVERASQKAIVIGKNGQKLKQIGHVARLDLEQFFAKKVFLKLWVKVKDSWADDERALASLGYYDPR